MSDEPDDLEFEESEFDDLDLDAIDDFDLDDLVFAGGEIRTNYPDSGSCPFCGRALREDDATVCKCRHCVCRWCADCDRARNIGAVCQLCGMIEFESNDCGLRAPLLPEWRDKF